MTRHSDRRPSLDSSQSTASASSFSLASSVSEASAANNRFCSVQLVKRAVAQLPLAVVSLLHVAGYKSHIFFDESDERLDGDFVRIWIWVTGIILLLLTVAELFFRVWSQGEGPLYKCRTWRKFFVPQMHKLEGFTLIVLLIGLGRSTNITLNWAEEGTSFGKLSNQMVTVSVPVYRVIRWMTDAQDVSVQRTFKKHNDLVSADKKLWAKEAREEREKYQRKIKVRMQEIVNLSAFQVLMVLLVLFHAFCYSLTITSSFLKDWFVFSFATGYVLTGIQLVEFGIRFWAQGGELYFMPFLNRAEFGCLLIGGCFVFYSTWYEDAKHNPEERFVPSGYLSAFFLLLHRMIRRVGIKYEINGDFSHANTVAGVKAVQLFMAKFGDILEIPEQNVHIGVQDAWIHKAKLRPEAFAGLHVPFTVKDGLFEELYIRMPDPLKPLFVFRLKNLLILLGPGDGLAEAGRLTERSEANKAAEQGGNKTIDQGDDADYWKYDRVVAAKAKLVDLVCKRIQPKTVERPADVCQPGAEEEDATASQFAGPRTSLVSTVANFKYQVKYQAAAVYGAVKRRLASIAKSTCQRVEVSISNVTIQYEDSEGCLGGPKNATVGARMGCAWLRFKQDSFLQCNVSRAGIYVEPMVPVSNKEAVGSLYCPTGHSWKEPVGNLLRQHPQQALKELQRFNAQEQFRLWAFEGTDNPLKATKGPCQPLSDTMRHRRMESWPEHRLVFMLLHVKLQAGTESGRAKLLEEEERQNSGKTLKAKSKSTISSGSPGKSSNRTSFRPSWGIFESPRRSTQDEGESNQQWCWNINTGRCIAPVSLMVDYNQVQCLHRMAACSKSWFALDNAFRWRPNVSLIEDEANALERNSVARQWWIYAIHRVLAQQRLRPRIPWLDAWWQVTNSVRYRALLAETSFAPAKESRKRTKESRKGSNHPKPEYLLRWMQELQVRLPLLVIVACHKNRQQRQVTVPKQDLVSKWTSRKPLKRVVSGVMQLPSQAAKLMSPKAVVPKSKAFVSTPEELVRTISGHSLFVLDDDDDDNSPSRAVSSESMAPMQIQSSAGLWEVAVPAFDVKILCPGKAPRPVLLHAKWRGIAVTAIKSDPGDENMRSMRTSPDDVATPGSSSSIFSATVTVDDFHVVSPEAGSLLLGGSRHICAVMQPVNLPPVPSGSSFVATQKEGKPLAFAFRGTARPGRSGVADLHLPHMRVIFYEPLMLALQKFTKKAAGSPSFDLEEMIKQRQMSIGKVLRSDGGGGCAMRNGRMGPFLKVLLQAAHTDSDETLDELLKVTGEQADYIKNVRRLRQLVKNAQGFRRKFEMLSGLAGAVREWRFDYHSGAIHLFQVGEYSKNELLVEEYQIRNFINAGHGASVQYSGSDAASRADLPSERLVMFEFNGYSDEALLPWGDARWHEDQDLSGCEELALEESAMWLIRAGGHKKKVKKDVKKKSKGNNTSTAGQLKFCRAIQPLGTLENVKNIKVQHLDRHGHVDAASLPDAQAEVTRSTWKSWCEGLPCILPGALSQQWPLCCSGLPEVRAEDTLTIDDTNINVIVENCASEYNGDRTLDFLENSYGFRPIRSPPCSTPSCTGVLQKVPRDRFSNGWLDVESARWRTWLLSNT